MMRGIVTYGNYLPQENAGNVCKCERLLERTAKGITCVITVEFCYYFLFVLFVKANGKHALYLTRR